MKRTFAFRKMLMISCLQTLLFGSLTLGQSSDQNQKRPPGCEHYDSVQIPAADLPTDQDRETLKSCVARDETSNFAPSMDLYFGISQPADPVKARACAYLERDTHQKTGIGGILTGDFGGAGMLTMIYANGKGAARSFDLALKFACECAEEDEPVNNARLQRLLKLQSQHWTGNDFSLCDDIEDTMQGSSSLAVAECRELQEHFEQASRSARLGKVEASWSSNEKQAFQDLQRAADAFFQASSENEIEVRTHGIGAGTDAEISEIDARSHLEDAFVTALENFERGQLPHFSPAQFKQSDAELNRVYKEYLKPFIPEPGEEPKSVTPDGIRTAQRAWLRYREAWVTFGQLKYPSVTADNWRAWVTEQRIEIWRNGD